MKKNPSASSDAAELRRRAEERLKRQGLAGGGPRTEVETARFVHELQVHMIELEMQNEELQQARDQAETLLTQYTDSYEFVPAGYLTLGRDGAIRHVNLAGVRLLGVERSRLVNRRFGQFVAEGDRHAFHDFLQQGFESPAKASCEVTLLREDSQPLVVEIEGTRSADGQECRAVVLDITARKRTAMIQEALYRISQATHTAGPLAELYRDIQQILGGLMPADNFFIALFDPDRDSVSFPYVVDRFDGTCTFPARTRRRGLTEHVLSTGRALQAPAAVAREMAVRGEIELIGTQHVDWLGVPLKIGERTVGVMAVQCYAEDVRFGPSDLEVMLFVSTQVATAIERKRAEETLQESEAKFRELAEYINDVFWIRSPDMTKIIYVSPAYETMWGRPPGNLYDNAQEWGDSIHPDDRSQVRECFQKLAAEQPSVSIEFRVVRPDGTVRWIHDRGFQVRDSFDRVVHTAGVATDITERKQAEAAIRRLNAELEQRVEDRTAELRAASQELEDFSYSVSHDLRAPLRAVNGFASILREDHATQLESEGQRMLEIIAGEGRRMGHLIDDLLAFCRLGRQPLERSRVDMEALAGRVFAELAGREPGRTLRLSLEPLPPACGDPAMLRQVWTNLLANAVKYTSTREVAQINIGSRTGGREITYFVQDNGVGFDMQYVGQLFGVFRRLHNGAEFEGTGVGLALTQRILRRHGGRVWADAAVDAGATFFFTLPCDGRV